MNPDTPAKTKALTALLQESVRRTREKTAVPEEGLEEQFHILNDLFHTLLQQGLQPKDSDCSLPAIRAALHVQVHARHAYKKFLDINFKKLCKKSRRSN